MRFSPLAPGEGDADDEALSSVTAGLAFTLETGTACAPGRPVIAELHWLTLQSDYLLVGDSSGRVRMWDTAPLSLGHGQVPDAIDVYPTADRIKVRQSGGFGRDGAPRRGGEAVLVSPRSLHRRIPAFGVFVCAAGDETHGL